MADFSEPKDRLAFALDVPDYNSAKGWVERLGHTVGVFKVGLELFTAEGPRIVECVQAAGANVFLDLKLHDIPATMGRATARAAALGVRYLTLHACAGREALERCVAEAGATRLLGVTVLTALDDAGLEAVGIPDGVGPQVARLAQLAHRSGLHGLVCAAPDLGALKLALPDKRPDFAFVTPGIRDAQAPADDQKRTMNASEARAAGADLLVVGRPIRDAADPVAAARALLDAIG